MRISHTLLIACFLGGTATTAWAGNAYVCKLRVETGFVQPSDTGFAQSAQMKVSALLMSKPYCQGSSAGNVTVTTPMLEQIRKRRKVVEHMSKARNVWQAAVATFQMLGIAAAQGTPLNQARVVAVNVEEEPAKDFTFQATRPASTSAKAQNLSTGTSGSLMRGYVCASGTKFRLGDLNTMTTVQDIHRFDVQLNTQPYCLGKSAGRKTYELGPPMKWPRKSHERMYQMTANLNAMALMHAINTMFMEAASAGQHVTISHGDNGVITSVEIMARPRDLAKEIKTIGSPGQ